MGKLTEISWTDHTFNPWWGCNHVSPGCDHCYMDTFVTNRAGYNGTTKPRIMGAPHKTTRRLFGPKHWAEPIRWNASAAARDERELVFCASMADVFEFHPLLDAERLKLWQLIVDTPYLDWQLLTKRPMNVPRMVPPAWMEKWPSNVWMGTSAEDQARFDLRYPYLAKIPAEVRFISAEPLLGQINFMATPVDQNGWETPGSEHPLGCDGLYGCEPKLSWIITGGESGAGHRPMEHDWVRSIRDDCANVAAFFHKQGGGFRPGMDTTIDGREHHEFPRVHADLPGKTGGVRAQAEHQRKNRETAERLRATTHA